MDFSWHRISFLEELLPLLEHCRLIQPDLEHVCRVWNREWEDFLILRLSSLFPQFHSYSSMSIQETNKFHTN